MNEPRKYKFVFTQFWDKQRLFVLDNICQEEGLDKIKLAALIEASHINKKDPFSADLIGCLNYRPSIFQALEISTRIRARLQDFV